MPMTHLNQTNFATAVEVSGWNMLLCHWRGTFRLSGHSDQGVVRIVTALNEVHGCGENSN